MKNYTSIVIFSIMGLIFIALIVFSNNNSTENINALKENSVNNEIKEDTIKTETEIEKKLKNNKKIFLKYWANMTYSEFIDVSDILVKEGTIQTNGMHYYININEHLVEILPSDGINYLNRNFENQASKKYSGIVLKSINDVVYNTYKEKYKLKELKYRNIFNGLIIQENPDYYNYDSSNSSYGLKTIKEIYGHQVTDIQSFINELNDKSKFYSTSDLDYLKEKTYLAPNEQIVKNKDNVIVISEVRSNFRKHTNDDFLNYIYVYEKLPFREKYSEIIKYAPQRIKIEPLQSEILIFYTSPENYNRTKLQEVDNLNKIIKEKEDFKKQGRDNIEAI